MKDKNKEEIFWLWEEGRSKVKRATRVDVISRSEKTSLVILKGYGKKGKQPGTTARVRNEELSTMKKK